MPAVHFCTALRWVSCHQFIVQLAGRDTATHSRTHWHSCMPSAHAMPMHAWCASHALRCASLRRLSSSQSRHAIDGSVRHGTTAQLCPVHCGASRSCLVQCIHAYLEPSSPPCLCCYGAAPRQPSSITAHNVSHSPSNMQRTGEPPAPATSCSEQQQLHQAIVCCSLLWGSRANGCSCKRQQTACHAAAAAHAP